jgi:hypothetical protein
VGKGVNLENVAAEHDGEILSAEFGPYVLHSPLSQRNPLGLRIMVGFNRIASIKLFYTDTKTINDIFKENSHGDNANPALIIGRSIIVYTNRGFIDSKRIYGFSFRLGEKATHSEGGI